MNTFKRKSLHAAVLAGLGAVGLAGAVQAQEVANVGRVFTYPYYTVPAAPAVAVEGKRSAEVLDFNLYLSPRDVWTGAVVLAGKATPNRLRYRGVHDLGQDASPALFLF